MKNIVKKCLKAVLIILILMAVTLVLYSVTVYEKDYPEYSSYNADGKGIKALYLLTGECGFHVSRYHYPVKFMKDNPVMVAYRPAGTLFNETEEQEGLKKWLNGGNTLVLILDERNLGYLWIFDYISEHKQWHEVANIGNITVTWYGLEKGLICVLGSADSFLNENISTSDSAVAFIKVLNRIGNPKVVFNEYYQFMQVSSPGIWELIGHTGQLMFVQILIVLVLVVIRGWKPFGRVRNERKLDIMPENEVVNAIAGLYRRMKAYPLVLANYYGFFTRKYGRYLMMAGRLQEKAAGTLSECEFYLRRGRLSRKELQRMVHRLEQLENEINNSGKN